MWEQSQERGSDIVGGGILAIYDLESGYADSLMQDSHQKQNMPFKTVAFTNKNALYEYFERTSYWYFTYLRNWYGKGVRGWGYWKNYIAVKW